MHVADQRGDPRRRDDRHEQLAALGRLLRVLLRDRGRGVHGDGGAPNSRINGPPRWSASGCAPAGWSGRRRSSPRSSGQFVAAHRQRELVVLDCRPEGRREAEDQHRGTTADADLEGQDRRGLPHPPQTPSLDGRKRPRPQPRASSATSRRAAAAITTVPRPVRSPCSASSRTPSATSTPGASLRRAAAGRCRRAGRSARRRAAPSTASSDSTVSVALRPGAGARVEPDHGHPGQPVPPRAAPARCSGHARRGCGARASRSARA